MIRSTFLAIPDGGIYPEDQPPGSPSSVSRYVWGEESYPFLGVEWVQGNPLSSTQIGFSNDLNTEPTEVTYTAGVGVTRVDTGLAYSDYSALVIWARHARGSTVGDWVSGI